MTITTCVTLRTRPLIKWVANLRSRPHVQRLQRRKPDIRFETIPCVLANDGNRRRGGKVVDAILVGEHNVRVVGAVLELKAECSVRDDRRIGVVVYIVPRLG